MRFALRVARFLAPLALVFAASQLALWKAGEGRGLASVRTTERRALAEGEDTLFARALVAEQMRRYKALELRARRPRIAVLGSSTSMQLRDFHFGLGGDRAHGFADGGFYNAGGLVQHTGDFEPVAALLDEIGSVRVVVLALDPWWFNDGWAPSRSIEPLARTLATSDFDADWDARIRAYPALVEALARRGGAAKLRALVAADDRVEVASGRAVRAIGLAARGGVGFRGSDGSRRNASFLARRAAGAPYADDEETLERIARRERRFETGALSARRVARLDAWLAWARARDVVLAGFAVPLAGPVRDAIAASPPHATYFAAWRAAMRDAFARAGQPFVDAVETFGDEGHDDGWMINGFHGSERTMAHVVGALLRDERFARAVPEASAAQVACLVAQAREQGLAEGPGACAGP